MPTIALVDDDRNILTSVSIALEGEGYRVQTYTDGSTALDGLGRRPRRSSASTLLKFLWTEILELLPAGPL